jgi:hypothetical protein
MIGGSYIPRRAINGFGSNELFESDGEHAQHPPAAGAWVRHPA